MNYGVEIEKSDECNYFRIKYYFAHELLVLNVVHHDIIIIKEMSTLNQETGEMKFLLFLAANYNFIF
jgi:hypothetical protein